MDRAEALRRLYDSVVHVPARRPHTWPPGPSCWRHPIVVSTQHSSSINTVKLGQVGARHCELTPSQMSVLSRLEKQGAASTSDLAVAERVRPQSMASAVAALEERAPTRRWPMRRGTQV
ncbi:MAG TPA: MarR family transcriptional regulator [Pseudonocardiaceae bacterium]